MAGWFPTTAGAPLYRTDDGRFLVKKGSHVVHANSVDEAIAALSQGGYEPASPADLDKSEQAKRVKDYTVGDEARVAAEGAGRGVVDLVTGLPRIGYRIAATLDNNTEAANRADEKYSGAGIQKMLQTPEQNAQSRQMAQDLPAAALGGRAIGEVVPALATGGISAVGEGLSTGIGSALGRAAIRAGAAGAEGAAAGVTQAGEDAWVGDTAVTGEAVANSALRGMLFGGGLSAGASAVGAVGRKAAAAFGRPGSMPKVTTAADQALGEMTQEVVGDAPLPGTIAYMRRKANEVGKAVEETRLKGLPEEDAALIRKHGAFAPKSVERDSTDAILSDYEGELTKKGDYLAETLNDAEKSAEKIRETVAQRDLNIGQWRKNITTDHAQAVAASKAMGAELLGETEGVVQSMQGVGANRANKALDFLHKQLDTLNETSDAAVAMNTVNRMKQDLQNTKMFYANLPPSGGNEKLAAQMANTGFDGIQEKARQFLENPQVWGKAGDLQKGYNAAIHNWLGPTRTFYNETLMKDLARRSWDGGPVRTVLDEKARSWLGTLGTGQGKTREAAIREYISGLKDVSEAAAKHMDLDPATLHAATENATKALAVIDELKGSIGAANQLRMIKASEGGAGLSNVAMAAMTGAPVGAADVGRAAAQRLGISFEPGSMAIQAAQLRTAAARKMIQTEEITKQLIAPVQKALSPSKSIKIPGAGFVGAAASTKEAIDSRYRRVAEQLATYQAQPDKLLEDATQHLGPAMPSFPQTTASITATTQRAVSFLSSKVPAPLQRGGGFTPLKPSAVSDTDKARFLRYVDAVDDPIGILKKVGNGSITDEHVQAVRAVYPSIFSAMQRVIAETVTTTKADAPYQIRLRMQKLFDVPIDPTMSPDFGKFMQAAATAGAAETQASQAARRPKGGKAPNVAKMYKNPLSDLKV